MSIQIQPNKCVYDWLMRVDTQYDKDTPKNVTAADHSRARESLGLGNTTNNYFFSSPQPAYGFNMGNTTTIHNTNVHNSSSDKRPEEDSKKKKTEEEKTNWKGIAAIGTVSTIVAGISIFVYARLSKAAEGARNYLENTIRIKNWSETSGSNPEIKEIAQVQEKIDQRAVDKITNYKYSILTSLVGILAMAGGGIAIFASAPVLATAGTTAILVGGVLNSIAVMYAASNCGMHWSDEEEGKKEFNEVKKLMPGLITSFNPNTQLPSSSGQSAPPSYDESQAFFIYNQRGNPNQIYPDLSGFGPTAPPYES